MAAEGLNNPRRTALREAVGYPHLAIVARFLWVTLDVSPLVLALVTAASRARPEQDVGGLGSRCSMSCYSSP